jgi:DNA-binding winged helix-turn-helix (wHTH) protein
MERPGPIVHFEGFDADFRTQELRKQGVRVKLRQQSFKILQMLLARPGELVTREELRQALWPGDAFVDFDHGLNNSIARLRDALATPPTPHSTLKLCPGWAIASLETLMWRQQPHRRSRHL